MTFLLHVVEFFLVAGLVVLGAAALAFVLARGYVRRHWRLVRGHVVTRGLLAGIALIGAERDRYRTRATGAELSQGSASRVRRRMWVAVEDAQLAVEHADSRQAPVAELPAVCRSLRGAADELDMLLRHERRLPASRRPDAVRRQVAEVIEAARDVQAAALQAGGDASEPQVRALVRSARDELEIVAAGLSRLRSVTQPR